MSHELCKQCSKDKQSHALADHNWEAPLTSKKITRWQHFQMDRMQPMLPVGTTAASASVQCQPTGEIYVLASDHDAEIESLRAALKHYGHHAHPNCHDLTLQADGSVGPRNGCLCGLDTALSGDSPENPCGSDSRPATAPTADTNSASSSDGASVGTAGLEAGTTHRPRLFAKYAKDRTELTTADLLAIARYLTWLDSRSPVETSAPFLWKDGLPYINGVLASYDQLVATLRPSAQETSAPPAQARIASFPAPDGRLATVCVTGDHIDIVHREPAPKASVQPEGPYYVRTFWSPDKRYLVTVHVTVPPGGDCNIIGFQDDDGVEWEPASEQQNMANEPRRDGSAPQANHVNQAGVTIESAGASHVASAQLEPSLACSKTMGCWLPAGHDGHCD